MIDILQPFEGLFYEDRRNRRFSVLVEDVARHAGMPIGNMRKTLARNHKNKPSDRALFSTAVGKQAISRRCLVMLCEMLPKRRFRLTSIIDAMDAFCAGHKSVFAQALKSDRPSPGENATQDDWSEQSESSQEATEDTKPDDIAQDEATYPAVLPAEFRHVYTICKATEVEIGGRVTLGVDAERLHEGLGVRTKWTDWMGVLIGRYGFVEGIDYEFRKSGNQGRGKPGLWGGDRKSKVCLLSLDCAKKIAMVQGGLTGDLIRRYYLWCEDTLASSARDQSSSDLMTLRDQLSQLTASMNSQVVQSSSMLAAIRGLSTAIIELKASPSQRSTTAPPPRQREPGEICITHFCDGRPVSYKQMIQLLLDMGFVEKSDYSKKWIATPAGIASRLVVNVPHIRYVDGSEKYDTILRLTRRGVKAFGEMITIINRKSNDKKQKDFFSDDTEEEDII